MGSEELYGGHRGTKKRGGTLCTSPALAPVRGEAGAYHANELHLRSPVLLSTLPLQVTLPHLGGHMGRDTPPTAFLQGCGLCDQPQGEAAATRKERSG